MKQLICVFFFSLLFFSCGKSGLIGTIKEDNFYGTWELTRYEKDGENLISQSTFTRTDLVFQDGDYLYGKFYSHSDGLYCNDTLLFFKIEVDLKLSTTAFEKTGVCNYSGIIDPLYYQNGTQLENKWHIKSFSKKLFILTNKKTDRDSKIEMMFEKLKDL